MKLPIGTRRQRHGHGIKLYLNGGTVGDLRTTLKLVAEIVKTDESGNHITEESEHYEAYCEQFGLKKEWLFKVMITGNESYKIMGLKPGRPKYPLIVKRLSDGKRFKQPAQDILRYFNLQS